VAECIEEHAKIRPDKVAIIFPVRNEKITYREFNVCVNRLANAFRDLGVKKGDRVAVFLSNCPEYLVSFFAACKIGAIFVPINAMLKETEVEYILTDSEANTLVTMKTLYEDVVSKIKSRISSLHNVILTDYEVEGETFSYQEITLKSSDDFSAIECEPEDLVMIHYTSGTTGKPKGAMLTHHNLNWFYKTWGKITGISDKDIAVSALQMTQAGGFHALAMPPLYYGGTFVIIPSSPLSSPEAFP